ncbi:hypothetical protein J1605_003147 [Eschrichtius robustus]|uniref:Adipocyte plasma membrane-associated protein n=1 Tax=Eschrichtius robustus TaxID=9764 RepID=A0AB34HTB4_ESCRO|nr:hypothetical protein J1605_003147 [Eschrichtius robustus]
MQTPEAAAGMAPWLGLAEKRLAATPAPAAGRGGAQVTSARGRGGRRGLFVTSARLAGGRGGRDSGSRHAGAMSEADGLRQRRAVRPQVVTDDARVPEAKGGSSFSGRVFRATFLMLAVFLTVPLLGAMMLLDSPIDPQPLSFKEPPLLLGVLQPNTKLRQAERLFENQLVGPESIAHIGDVMFTGTADGRVVKLENGEVETIARFGSGPCKTRDDEPACGRPLGIRAGPNGTLFVADAYKGLFEVNPWKREVKLLLSSETPIEGRKMSFVNDLTVTRDGRKIYFTDSSSKWQRRDYLLLVMEGTDDGRNEGRMARLSEGVVLQPGETSQVASEGDSCEAAATVALPGAEPVLSLLEYDTETKEVKVLLDHLRFPNGVQLSPAEDFVLVAELTMARIRRFYVSGLMKGGADLFVENLPGFPDNIRASSSGGYWVGMSTIRSNPGFSMLDFLSERPYLKRMIFKPGAATRPYLQDPRSALLQNVPALGCLVFLTVRFRLCLSGALSVTCREVPGVPLSLQCPSPHPLFSQETVMKFVPRYSLVLELSDSGAFRRSLHDPDGQVAAYVSEVHEHDGHLYLGSFRSPFLCRLRLQSA